MSLFDSPATVWRRIRLLLFLLIATGLAWGLIEALIYRSGLYYRVLAEPHSNTGTVALHLERARREATAQPATVLVMGDSRIGEGFSKPLAEAAAPGLNFINAGLPGSTPRVWYYFLRALIREGIPLDTLVVGIGYYPRNDWRDWALDPAFMAPLVGLGDLADFSRSFASAAMRRRARHGIFFPALLMQKDTQALLANPKARLKALKGKRWWLDNASHYAGRELRMPELAFDAQGQALDWSPASAEQRQWIEQHVTELEYVYAFS